MEGKEWNDNWLHFTRKARRGIFVFLFLFILIAISPRIYYNFIQPIYPKEISVTQLPQTDQSKVFNPKKKGEQNKYTPPSTMFDPNAYSVEDWKAVGLSEKQAASILKYLSKGSGLKTKEDLKKIFVIDEELYTLLEPKIDLPDFIEERQMDSPPSWNSNPEKEETDVIDEHIDLKPVSINKATEEELLKIKGIGPFFAKEILKIRKDYGGIIAAEQLLDIYRMDTEKLESILTFLKIDANEVNKLNINTATEEELASHPLITKDIAKSIVYYRKNYKSYASLDELLLSPYIDIKKLKQLTPYLKTEQ